MNPNIGKKKLKTFKVNYYYTGIGRTFIKAKTEEEAREIWLEGQWEEKDNKDWGEDYNVEDVEEVKK